LSLRRAARREPAVLDSYFTAGLRRAMLDSYFTASLRRAMLDSYFTASLRRAARLESKIG